MNKKRKSANEMIPGDTIHPGEIIKDELEARNMSQQELADKMGISKSEISYLLNGHRNISAEMAVMLEKALDIDAEFWMNLRMKYDIDCARKNIRKSIDTAKIPLAKKQKLRSRVAA